MSLIHDIAEGIVGDFTPYCQITYLQFNLDLRRNSQKNMQQSNKSSVKWVNKIANIFSLCGINTKIVKLMTQR